MRFYALLLSFCLGCAPGRVEDRPLRPDDAAEEGGDPGGGDDAGPGGSAGGDDGAVVGSGGDDDAETPLPRYAQLIRSAPYAALALEIDSVPGQEPVPGMADEVAAALETIVAKPGGVTTVEDGDLASQGDDHAWSFSELNTLAGDTFDLEVPADTIKIHVLFVDGHYDGDEPGRRVLGIAWGHKSIVMFKQSLTASCNGGLNALLNAATRQAVCAAAETSVLTHEIGHLLGLVDNGLAMVQPHRDPDPAHGAHDASDACVMYWAYQGEEAVDLMREAVLGGSTSVPSFDAACLDDVAAVRDAP